MSTTLTGGGVVKKTKRVYLISGTVYTGYGVCYNWDAVGDVDGNAFTTVYGRAYGTTMEKWCDARHLVVEEPSSLNNQSFAGVVDRCSNGVTGPNWIQIHTPGSICEIFCTLSARGTITTSGATPIDLVLSTRNRGDMLTFTIATADNGEFKYRGFPGRGSAKVLQAASAADQLIMAELMDGNESGGVQMMACTTTLSCTAGVTVTMGGITLLSATAAASGVTDIVLSAGSWVGMRKQIVINAATSNFTLLLSAPLGILVPVLSLEFADCPWIAGTTWTVLSAQTGGTYLDLEWNGLKWVCKSYGGDSTANLT